AKLCADNDIIFIGPDAELIKKMGDKVSSRKLMEDAGIPTIPGSKDVILTPDDALKEAESIGYPLMLKASAGGGGIGMQIVHDKDLLKDRSEEHTSELQSRFDIVCRLLLETKKRQ